MPQILRARQSWEPRDRVLGDDFVLPFELERPSLRGRLIRLGPSVNLILRRHGYPTIVSRLLGEALALATCLASTIKLEDGVFTLQARGSGGPVRMLVADVTSSGVLRGYVGFDNKAVAALVPPVSVARLFGGGHVAFTVDQGSDFERYQGIVELKDEGLADSVHHYFRQSEQIATGIKVAAHSDKDGRWRAGAVMVQKLPDGTIQGAAPEDIASLVEDDEGFRRAAILLGSATEDEIVQSSFSAEEVLLRLFHEEQVRVYDKRPVYAGCRCKLARVEDVLRQFGRKRVEEFKVDGVVTVTCEFCAEVRVFNDSALDSIYAA